MSSAYDVVRQFEERIALFAGAPHAVAIDSCTNALLLACRYVGVGAVWLPARTYCSVPMAVIHAGGQPMFDDREWTGAYQLEPTPIWDAAKRLHRGMFARLKHEHGAAQVRYVCLSFHIRKHLPIGRGGMILTDDAKAAAWFRMARRDGRDDAGEPGWQAKVIGWNCYLTPEQAARGLMLLDVLPSDLPDQVEEYPDLREWAVFNQT